MYAKPVVGLTIAPSLLVAGLATSPPTAAAAEPKPYIGGFGVEYASKHRNGAVVCRGWADKDRAATSRPS